MIKEVLVVEGRSDVARIRASHIDVDMITTDGFNLKPHTLDQIRCAYEKRGIIILTDPDRAGEQIRKFLTDRFPNAKHAFIPRKDAIANLNGAGLNGSTDASDRRAQVGAILGIGYGNAKQFLKRLNHYGVTRQEWDQAIRQIDEVK